MYNIYRHASVFTFKKKSSFYIGVERIMMVIRNNKLEVEIIIKKKRSNVIMYKFLLCLFHKVRSTSECN